MAHLVLVRHGETTWNAEGLFTGQTDVPLNEQGKTQAKKAAKLLGDITFNVGYTSNLSRSKDTLRYILEELKTENIKIIEASALNERRYGVLEGKSKNEAVKEYGEEEVHKLRRAWNYDIPHGETLKVVYERVVPYFQDHILKDLKNSRNVIISGHNNTMRALIKYFENLSDSGVEKLELGNGEIYIYTIAHDGTVTDKEILNSDNKTP